jgi:hypothetical protein
MLAATRPYFTAFRAPSQVKIRQKGREGYANRQTLRHPFRSWPIRRRTLDLLQKT